MATLATTHPTLLDFRLTLDPNNKVGKIIEVLNQTNEVLEDMVWQEGNLLTGHQTIVRTGLPAPTWRKLYGGVQPTKGSTAKVTEATGMLEAYAEIDKALADLNGNREAWRMGQDRAHIEGMSQEFVQTLFYGNEATLAEEFTGFAPRFNDQAAQNGDHILTSAATPDSTDNTSMWLVGWGPNTVYGIYPAGTEAGLQVEDLGRVTIESIDGAGGRMEAYRSHYVWKCGLCVEDWRYVVRINYDLEDIVKSGSTGPVLGDLMAKAMRRVPNLSNARWAFYANRDSLDALDLQQNNNSLMAFRTMEDAQGKMVTRFRGIPIRRVDQLLSTESGI